MVSRNGQRARGSDAADRDRVPALVTGSAGQQAARPSEPSADTATPEPPARHAPRDDVHVPRPVRRRMRSAVLSAPHAVEIRELPLPEPRAGEVRVHLLGCGVCASSLPAWEGRESLRYPFEPGAPGHEGYGVVDAVGPGVDDLREGDRVALFSQRAYAEYDVAPADEVVRLPGVLADLPFLGEPLGRAMNVLERSRVYAGHDVAIVGVGFLGAALTALCAQAGARVVAISRRPYALGVAARSGALETLSSDDGAAVEQRVLELTGGRGCDRVIECAGQQESLDLAARLTRVRGRLVIAGSHLEGSRRIDLQLWNARGLDVVNAHEPDPGIAVAGIRRAVLAVEGRTLDPAALCTHRFPLDALGEAFEVVRARPDGFLKAVVVP